METQYDNLDIFRRSVMTFKETSKDTDSGEAKYMTQSEIEVVNFDEVKNRYIKDMKLSITPCSNDALYISATGEYYFIEFKNGVMKKEKIYNVYNKIYDSLLIFNDIINQNISFCRENVNFILVYNESKNPNENEEILINPKVAIGKHFSSKAKTKFVRFDLNRFKKIYFKEVYTYTEKEFEEEFLAKLP